jgi:putative addiction module killer protein
MELEIYEIKIYQDSNGKKPFIHWLDSLTDRIARAKIKVRLARMRLGNSGDWKSLGSRLYEIRIDEGPGYRIYFTQDADSKIILLGGSKKKLKKKILIKQKCT